MIDLRPGQLLQPVAAVAAEITGARPSPATIWRWHAVGTAALGRLPTVRIGGSVQTTDATFREWLQGAYAPLPAAAENVELPDASDDALRAAGLL